VDSRSEDTFVEHDLAFLQGAANILGMAIERARYERYLNAAVDRHEVLLKEINHRVKNSLAIVASMLRLQSAEHDDPMLTQQLEEASLRVAAVARAHDRLYQNADIETLDVGVYVEQVCKDLDEVVAKCEIVIAAERGIVIATDRAIASALIASELITNAAKYAYEGRSGEKIWVRVSRAEGDLVEISVRDEGAGLPAAFDLETATSLGMRIIGAFAQQLGAQVKAFERSPGTEFFVSIPLRDERETSRQERSV
jgi:two-component sensor histidine kinase